MTAGGSPSPSSLLASLRWALGADGKAPPPPVDWALALNLAKAQGLHLFLYPPLRRNPPDGLPDGLRAEYLAGVRDGERRRAQAGELFSALNRAGIPFIPLKGIWLSEHVYPDPAERPMHDLDVLVRLRDVERASAVMKESGYAGQGVPNDKHRVFLHPDWPLPVELHGRLDHAGPLALDPEPLWERAVPSSCCGQPCLTLEPHDLVLALVRHTLLHSLGFYPLRSLVDIALVLKKEGPAIDLHELHARARAVRMVRGLALVVAMAEELAGFEREADWPADWNPDPDLLREAWSLTLQRGGVRAHPPESLLRLEELRDLRDRLRLLGRRLFLSAPELEARYPWAARRGLRPFALAARLGDLVRLYAGALVRLAKRDPALLEALDVSRERRGWLARIYPDPPA
jgi:hypothetical protein